MTKGPVRRGQLIAPFGVGALSVVRDGVSVITCGLDHWFEREGGKDDLHPVDVNEFRVEEWRLQRRLGVSYFLLPPDFRVRRRNDDAPNFYLTVPFLRFPKWNFCPACKLLIDLPLTVRAREKCPECLAERSKKVTLLQVPFVAMCDRGHIQDFPWREWVHESASTQCTERLSLTATGGASLAAQKVKCECGAQRNLSQITTAYPDGTTYLSRHLDSAGTQYSCRGMKPWLGENQTEPCSSSPRGSLRSASNLYFADVYSALYLPRRNNSAPAELVDILQEPPLSTLISLLIGANSIVTPEILRGQQSVLLQPYTDQQIEDAIKLVTSVTEPAPDVDSRAAEDTPETTFRRAEFHALRNQREEEQLLVRPADLSRYEIGTVKYFERVMLVHKLRETRALGGFTRVFPPFTMSLPEKMRLLRRDQPEHNWLPAYIVYGEGLYFEFREQLIRQWSSRPGVQQRVANLAANYMQVQQSRGGQLEPITPRLLLLHTFSHLLINRLTFECGYSTAALRERLYVSDDQELPMAAVLIYTAAGDAEGTMGGLVRMGKPGYFEPLIRRALEEAKWCSADPVCMEMGRHGGQGPDSCNLAACHSCALVPETACERFNRLLDRACVIGDASDSELGFFSIPTSNESK